MTDSSLNIFWKLLVRNIITNFKLFKSIPMFIISVIKPLLGSQMHNQCAGILLIKPICLLPYNPLIVFIHYLRPPTRRSLRKQMNNATSPGPKLCIFQRPFCDTSCIPTCNLLLFSEIPWEGRRGRVKSWPKRTKCRAPFEAVLASPSGRWRLRAAPGQGVFDCV